MSMQQAHTHICNEHGHPLLSILIYSHVKYIYSIYVILNTKTLRCCVTITTNDPRSPPLMAKTINSGKTHNRHSRDVWYVIITEICIIRILFGCGTVSGLRVYFEDEKRIRITEFLDPEKK